MKEKNAGLTYASAGVDIDAGSRAVELMRDSVRSTFREGVLTDIGGFGGLFALDSKAYSEPVLVSGTDGVGTKLRAAILMDKHDTIGIDAVAMCVNDILVQGAEPLFFLDYLAVGKLVPEKVAEIIKGVAEGCKRAGCALIGGETAEMPGFYKEDEYDIAGFAVGVADKSKIIDGSEVALGDVLIGISSSGLHSNGYSLVRKTFFEVAGYKVDTYIDELGRTVGEEMLEPTTIYVKQVLPLLEKYKIKAMAHITGGGLSENIPRVLPTGTGVSIVRNSWEVLPVFKVIQKIGRVEDHEMLRTFNMGVGMVLVVDQLDSDGIIRELKGKGIQAGIIGQVVPSAERIVVYR
ncbi:MAG: phosphoribosylformylglycinamidine cyclo-ligase [Peptococcaceae bacterium]|nr:phosphoribosylformylglycinamidine cyclo-ligase [Peptococcaceae bacterium]